MPCPMYSVEFSRLNAITDLDGASTHSIGNLCSDCHLERVTSRNMKHLLSDDRPLNQSSHLPSRARLSVLGQQDRRR